MKPSSITIIARNIASRSSFATSSKQFLHVSATARRDKTPRGLSSNSDSATFDAKLWASMQPPPASALSALAARLRLSVASDANSDNTITLPLLAQIVTHPSFVDLHQRHYPHEAPPAHNGLLAALGNQLMGLFAMEWIVTTYPHLPTNVVKATVTAYVGPTTSAMIAKEWGVAPLVRWMRKPGALTKRPIYHDDALASVARAIVGLVYHANGSSVEKAREFVHAHFLSRELDIRPLLKYSDPKLALIHTVRKYQREPPVSRLLQESGRESNSPTFIVGVFSGEDKLGEGFGSSLDMAEYRAAENAMHRLYLTRQPVTDSMLPTTTFPSSLPVDDPTTSQEKPEHQFKLLELSASSSGLGSNDSKYTPGLLGDSEARYGSAGRSGIKVGSRGARISLTSVADIRYKGILMGINHAESTIQLSDVVSMGTESRRPPAEFIPPPTHPMGLWQDPNLLARTEDILSQDMARCQWDLTDLKLGPLEAWDRLLAHMAAIPNPSAAPGKPNEQQPAQLAGASGEENAQSQPSTQGQPQAQPVRPVPSAGEYRAISQTRMLLVVPLGRMHRFALRRLRWKKGTWWSSGGRGGGAQHTAGRVQVPDTDFDFEAMNAKFDKANLRPNESESDSESESEDDAPVEGDKKEKGAKFYNPQRSFFDDISSDSNLKNEGGNPVRGRGRGRGALGRQRREEERNRNLSTFGETGAGAGFNNGFGYGFKVLEASKEALVGAEDVAGEVVVEEVTVGAVLSVVELDDFDVASTVDAATEQNSAASVFSFSSSRDGSAMLREAEGRIFNSQNELYYLPADELEYSRLDKQHLVHLLMNDGLIHRNVVNKVRAVLDPSNVTSDGSHRRVLDLDPNGLDRAISMALEFPHAEVVGVTNFREFINDMGLLLATRFVDCGILLVIEGDLQLWSYNREPQEIAYGDGDRNKSYGEDAFCTMKGRGSHVDANVNLYNWLCQNPLFEDEDWGKLFTPIGPWETRSDDCRNNKLQIIGELMRQNSLVCQASCVVTACLIFNWNQAFVRALKPLLISEGYAPEIVDRFIAGTDRDQLRLRVAQRQPLHLHNFNCGLSIHRGRNVRPNQFSLEKDGENKMYILSSSVGSLERMSDVGLWAAQSSGVAAAETDSGSEHGSEEEFIDVDSDGDVDIEDVTDA
ncbi:Ribonuclease III [Rhizoctonia solani]|uniref:Large ribosomal subunit protein mL44 n=1 Tax=Rhizoctonia solani TaxID=456999 RepID=A0A8H7IES7_9AGAM|nr:Ribonuclease III [Rhizoctonia solani]